jgi:hypothetical protein
VTARQLGLASVASRRAGPKGEMREKREKERIARNFERESDTVFFESLKAFIYKYSTL